jgi:hypothetical protein
LLYKSFANAESEAHTILVHFSVFFHLCEVDKQLVNTCLRHADAEVLDGQVERDVDYLVALAFAAISNNGLLYVRLRYNLIDLYSDDDGLVSW